MAMTLTNASQASLRRGVPSRFVIPRELVVEAQRPELLSLLNDRSKRVLLLNAPSGYGKTVLLAQWARSTKDNVLWLRLAEDDKDPRMLLAAIAQVAQLNGLTLPQWGALDFSNQSRERLLESLTNDLNNQLNDYTFVIDEAERLGVDAAQTLTALIGELGEGHRIIVGQREGTPFNITPYLHRGEGVELGMKELAFTPAISKEVAVALELVEASDQSKEVTEAYSGWPAAIVLSLQEGQTIKAHQSPQILVKQLLQRLPSELRIALPILAVMEFWTVHLPRDLGLDVPADWLTTIETCGLPLSHHESAVMPHSLVRQELLTELELDRAALIFAHQKAGRFEESRGNSYAAILHYVKGNESQLAVALAEQLSPRWYRFADWRLVIEALQVIPEGDLTTTLRSLLVLAYTETGQANLGMELAEKQLAYLISDQTP